MRQTLRLLTTLLLLSCMLGACKKDMFNADTAQKIMDLSFHNDSVDKRHDWSLINDWTIRVKANVKGVRRIELLSGNPYTDNKTELLANTPVVKDNTAVMCCSMPKIADSLYVAAVDSTEHYYVMAVDAYQYDVDFSNLNTVNSGTLKDIGQQEVYYCFCASYPEPSQTWGFNDCVMRIAKELRDSRTLRITVTVAAVGTTNQIAAALRLSGVKYEQVEKIEPVGGKNFKQAESLPRYFIEDEDVLLKGQDGSAVINMFDDAHATFYNKTNTQGVIPRNCYNVSHSNDASQGYYEFSEPSVSYDVTFKTDGIADGLTFSSFDPFILVNYAGTTWEVHKYAYKFNETLKSYYSGQPLAYDNGYAWALEIPYSWFRYPLIEYSMGSYKKGALYGAYQTFDHSFGEWGTNKDTALDWYLYPNTSMVY